MGSSASRRYTSGMKLALLLSRHRRLLALCGLSAAAHLLVLELAARRAVLPLSAPPAGEALRLRLVRTGASVAATPAAASAPVRSAPLPSPEQDIERRADAASAAPAPAPAPPAAAPSEAPAAAPAEPASEAAGTPLVQMPGRYRVRMPEPVRLAYALTRQAPGAAPVPGGSASIAWASDGEHYTLAIDGVLGRLRSEGGSSDAGIAPRRTGKGDGGAMQLGDFVEDAVGAQDSASVLMQLAGIGLAEPDQIAGQLGNELRIVIAGADRAAIERYRVMGQETVPTALGELAAWRLAQVAPASQERLEVWLAPGQGWLPVQLRLTRPDGDVITQTLTRIEPGQAR
jgi:hypothetical protein